MQCGVWFPGFNQSDVQMLLLDKKPAPADAAASAHKQLFLLACTCWRRCHCCYSGCCSCCCCYYCCCCHLYCSCCKPFVLLMLLLARVLTTALPSSCTELRCSCHMTTMHITSWQQCTTRVLHVAAGNVCSPHLPLKTPFPQQAWRQGQSPITREGKKLIDRDISAETTSKHK